MSTALAPIPSTARPLALRMRRDLAIHPLMFGGRRYWGVKDPVALDYFQLRDEEFFVLKLLDGRASSSEVIDRFEEHFAPRRLSSRQLQAFIGMLHEQGLIVADAAGQGEELLVRHGQTRRRELFKALSQVLALRFKGIDPEPFIRRLHAAVSWMYSPYFLGLCALLIFAALALVAVQIETVYARLPAFHAFFSLQNAVWLAGSIAGVKVLHELAHAATLKHFGGECHTMGFMLLVFTPALYCDVSDAWMMPNKWHRIAISSAGIALELVLAAVCTFLWWFSEPGLFNAICLNIMFVCSISTLLFNGNPLLRFDGYYILFDLIEVPNLRKKSFEIITNAFKKWLLGIDPTNEQLLPERHRGLLAVYGIASMVYRVFIIATILYFAHKTLKPRNLEPLANLVGALAVGGLLFTPVIQTVRFMADPVRTRDIRWRRFFSRGGLVAMLLAGVLLVPLPYRVAAPVVVQPEGASRIYVSVPGVLVRSVDAGEPVKQGETLAVLQNLEVQLDVEKLRGERDRQRLHIANLERQQVRDADAESQLPTAREKLADLEERLQKRMLDQEKLTLTAPKAGIVLMPQLQSPRAEPGELASWKGTPLDRQNFGSFLDVGTTFCLVGDPGRLEAVLAVDQSVIEFVRVGQRVKLLLDELPDTILWGTISELAEVDLDVAPRELRRHADLPTRTDESGVARPMSATYQARVAFDRHERSLLIDATGRAKIVARPQTLAARLLRFVRHTFRIEL